MDGDNPRLLLSLDGSCMGLSLFQRRPRQASGSPTRPSGHRVNDGVNSFNTVEIHHAVEHDVQALEGHQGLAEKLLV